MGRKIEMKKIENTNNRQVTFSKRRAGLLKKAHELSVLCDAELAVIIFSNTGKVFDFASSSMNQILARYHKCIESSENSGVEHVADVKKEMQEVKEVDFLKEEIAKLKLKQQRLTGRDLKGAGVSELQQLEQLLNEGLLSVKDKKEQILKEQLEQSRVKEHRVMQENATLRKQIVELNKYLPISAKPVSTFPGYCRETINSLAKHEDGFLSAATVCKSGADNGDLVTTFHLGFPYNSSKKRKEPETETPEKETHSGTSESQVDM